MDNFDDKNNGELKGFDSVNGKEIESDNSQGYTVTPDGGYYTKQKDDIIQDDISKQSTKSENTNEVKKEENKDSTFIPNGEYSSDSYNNQKYTNNIYHGTTKQFKEKRQKRYGGGVIAIAAVLAAVIGATSGILAVSMTNKKQNNPTPITESNVSGSNVNIKIDETAESVVEAVATKVTPSVIGIRTTTSVMNFFGGSQEATGEGSGVVYSSDGYIITNYHVIADAVSNKTSSKIEVFIDNSNSKSYQATVVGYNISTDLAVIKINVTGLTPIEVGTSSSLKVGQYVITVGNPGGLEFMDSVTYGVISGLNRVVSASSNVSLIQTDAAINPGNSGGALVNTKGQLVGINSSKIVSEEYEGMGFAIPSDKAIEICKNIISKENDPEPYIGISVSEKYTADVLKYYGYPTGAVVLSVAEGSPAANSGIAKGDIITEFNSKEVTDYKQLDDLISDCKPKQSISVKIYRSGRYYTTTIKVGSNNSVN